MKDTLIHHLELISQLKALDGSNRFSVGAYEKASKIVRDMDDNFDFNHPDTIDGIGIKIAHDIQSFVKTGTSPTYQDLIKRIPVECLSMTVVNSIGPKKAFKFYQQGIKNFDALVREAEGGKLDPKLTQAVLFARDTQAGRVPYDSAKYVAEKVLEVVNSLAGIEHAEICGSIRRHKETIKDIDIVAATKISKNKWPTLFDRFLKALGDKLIGVNNKGDVKCSIDISITGIKMRCDLWLVEPWYYGSALNYATGSKKHNEQLRGMAVKKGLRVNEYGIFERGTEHAHDKEIIIAKNKVVFVKGKGNRLGGEKEEDLYRLLGIDYVSPENRE